VTTPTADAEAAFRDFVDASASRLGRLCWALTGDRALGEDLAQATLERLWPRWRRVEKHGDPWAYTCKIAVTINASWRRRRRWTAEIPTEVTEGSTRSTADHEDGLVAGLDIERWLAQLGPRQREVVILRFLNDLGVDETAAAMGCSVGTVKSQTARALSRLRAVASQPNARY
jgi:RNA polymerase sigma-70 factor (sigma-E family)